MVVSLLRTTRFLTILLGLIALIYASTDQSDVFVTEIKGVTLQKDGTVNDSRFEKDYTQEDLLVMHTLEISCVQKGTLMFDWEAPESNFRYDPKAVTYHLFLKLGEDYNFTSMEFDKLIKEFKKEDNHHYFEIKEESEFVLKNIKPTNKMYSVLLVAQAGEVMSDISKSRMDVFVHSIVPKTGNYTYSSHVSFEADKDLKVTTKAGVEDMYAKLIFKAKKNGHLPKKLMQITVNTTLTGTISDGTVIVRKVKKVKFQKGKVITLAYLSDVSEILSRFEVDGSSLVGAKNETDDGRYEINILDIRIEKSYPIIDGLTFETMFNLFSKIKWGFSINWRCLNICPCFGGCCFCLWYPNGIKDVYAILHAGFRAEAKFVLSKEWEKTWEDTINLFNSPLKFITIWAGYIPIIFTYRFHMDVDIELSMKASVEAEIGAWLQGDLQFGLRQRGSSSLFDPVKVATFSKGLWLPQDTFKASFSLDADAGLHLYTKVLVYHLVGGRIGVKPGVSFGTVGELTSSGFSTTKFDIDLYLKMPLAFIVGGWEAWTGEYTLFTQSLLPSVQNIALDTSGLGWCKGDCDSDAECNIGLRCMQRAGSEPLISCQGNPWNGWDYCVPVFIF